MDLSKIPEPSDEDLSDASFFLSHPPYSKEDRVIAHLLRRGRVLAKVGRYCEEHFDILEEDDLAAISFFEKFGGE